MTTQNGWLRLESAPEWRWLRAGELVASKIKPRYSADDNHVRRAYDFKKKYDKRNQRRVYEASERWPDIFDAFTLYKNEAGNAQRWFVEAGVVADRTKEDIGVALHVDPRTIETYEKLFFDVRHMLDNPYWIHTTIIHPAHTNSVSNANPDLLWKTLAFVLGWDVLCGYMNFGEVPVPIVAKINSAVRSKVAMNGLMATLQTPINAFNCLEVTELAVDLIKHEEEVGSLMSRDQNQTAFGEVLRAIQVEVVSAHEKVGRFEPRRLPALPPPDIFETSRKQPAEVKQEGVPDGKPGKAG